MSYNKERVKKLLVSILGTLADATVDLDVEDTDFGTMYYPVLRFIPTFEFTEDDIKLIRELGEEEMDDFSTLTEDYERI